MTFPSKPKQVEAVMAFLDSEFMETRTLEEVAKAIVDGYHDLIESHLKSPATPLVRGVLVKSPTASKIYRVAWNEGDDFWVVGETDAHGYLAKGYDEPWAYWERHHPSIMRVVEVDADGKEKKKRFPMTDEEIEEAWSNPEWVVGDQLSMNQRQLSFTVIAVAPSSALLRGGDGRLMADSNANLARYYRREKTAKDESW